MNADAKSCWIAGYSFGAWIGMQLLMRRPEIDGFISVAPPANSYDFSFLAPCPSSGLIVTEKDEVVPRADVQKLVHKLSHERDIRIDFAGAPGPASFLRSHTGDGQAVRAPDGYIGQHLRAPGDAPVAAASGRGR